MPVNMQGAVYARLIATAGVTTKLPLYRGAPAVFTSSRIPEDAPFPCVVVKPPIADDPADTKTTQARSAQLPVDVVDNAQLGPTLGLTSGAGSVLPVEALARAVRDALHRAPLSFTGYNGWRATVSGPEDVPSDATVHVRRLIVNLGFEKE